MNITLLYVVIVVATISLVISGLTLFMLWRQRAYFKRIMRYGSGLADIQATLKDMALEHHTLMEELVENAKNEVIRHVTFTNRWQKVIAKLIRIKGETRIESATGSESLKEASDLHDIGLDIAKVAFEDKLALESDAEGGNPEPTPASSGVLQPVG